jgi:plastocyanin
MVTSAVVPPTRRPRPAPPARPQRRAALLITLITLGISLLVVTPMALISLRQETASVLSGPSVTLEIVAGASGYTPDEIRVPRGANVRLDFVNRDPGAPHDLQTFGQRRDVRVIAWPGETRPTIFKAADRPGRYRFLSTIRGRASAGYAGIIIVE